MPVFVLAALLTTGAAAIIDWRRREIPNWLALGTLGVAVVAHGFAGALRTGAGGGIQEASWAVVGAVACAFVPAVFWQKGVFGGGDVKMLAALGALLQPMQGIEAEFYSLILAAVFAPARLAWEGKLLQVLGNSAAIVMNPLLPKAKRRVLAPEMLTQVRFGPAIFAGVVVCALAHRGGP
jgi:prepilin peptidase CpaA